MKKRMKLKELREYFEKNKPHYILYLTENQDWRMASDPLKIQMSFPVIQICENPNMICLKSGENVLWFDQVRCAEIIMTTVLGVVIRVFCGDHTSGKYEVTYTLVAA